MTDAPSLDEQATAVELQALGLREQVARAERKEIKRPPHEVERMRARLVSLDAATQTMKFVAERAAARAAEGRT